MLSILVTLQWAMGNTENRGD